MAQETTDKAPAGQVSLPPESEPTPLVDAWLPPEQWVQVIEQQRLDGLVRTLAEHCVAARTDAGWQLAVVPEQAHLQRSKGQALAERLGRVEWVDWPAGQQSVVQWRTQQTQARLQQAREAFINDPAVQRVMELFDAKVIEASIQPKDS